MKHRPAKIGLGIYVLIWLFILIGSAVLPLRTYEHEPLLADLPPANSYLSIPDVKAERVKKIVSGTTYGAVLLDDGTLQVWGDHPFSLPEIEGMRLFDMASGAQHMVLVDQENQIYEIGKYPYAQTSLSALDKEFLRKDGILEVYASDTYSACLSNSGYLYFWGMTDALNEIPEQHQGHIQKAAVHPYHIAYLLDDGTVHMNGRNDRLSHIPREFTDGTIRVLDLAISYESVFVVDEDHHVHTWGDVIYDVPDHLRVRRIVSGRRNVHLLYEDGSVVGMGADSRSLSYGDALYSGYFQTYVLQDGDILAWGNSGFPIGSDAYGRDLLTRLAHGGFITLLLGLPACLISLLLAVFLGLLSGYRGGWIDRAVIRLSECISSIPFLPIVVTLSAFMMDNTVGYIRMIVVMVLYGCVSWPSLARLIRIQVMAEREADYVRYEEMIGASSFRIMIKHILPSTFPMIAADIASLYASSILMEASLSFLGFGVPLLYPSWGNMLQTAQSMHVIENCWWQWFFPALFVFLSVLAVHFFSEGIRREYHPKE